MARRQRAPLVEEREHPYRDFFDHKRPLVTEIRGRYPHPDRVIDLNQSPGLTHRDVADAIMEAGRTGKALYIPEESAYQIWNRGTVFRKGGVRIPLDSPYRFKKFGPHVDLTKSNTRVRDIRQQRMTPRRLMRERLSDGQVREALLNGAYRGIGWWDPKKRTHRLTPFDVFPEGRKFYEFFGPEMMTEFQRADCRMLVPSLSREFDYVTQLKVLPVTLRENQYYVEWLMTEGGCQCEDWFYLGTRTMVEQDQEAAAVFKYANPEHYHCRHFWGALEKTADMSERNPGSVPFRLRFPRVTGLFSPWYALKTRTLIGDERRARRPLKAEISILCGKVMGYETPDRLFDLDETEPGD